MPTGWDYLPELHKNKAGTLAVILKHNAPKYIKQEIQRLIKEGKIKNIQEIVEKAVRENKSLITVLEELGVKNIKNKFGKGARRCAICKSHERIIRKYGLYICGRCFREQAKLLGWKVMGE
jgi:ribosomal protein S14